MSLAIQGSGGGAPSGTPTIETGSYVGTGNVTRSLTFSNTPKMIFITGEVTNNPASYNYRFGVIDVDRNVGFFIETGQGVHTKFMPTVNGKTVTLPAGMQNSLNRTDCTYYYKSISY